MTSHSSYISDPDVLIDHMNRIVCIGRWLEPENLRKGQFYSEQEKRTVLPMNWLKPELTFGVKIDEDDGSRVRHCL